MKVRGLIGRPAHTLRKRQGFCLLVCDLDGCGGEIKSMVARESQPTRKDSGSARHLENSRRPAWRHLIDQASDMLKELRRDLVLQLLGAPGAVPEIPPAPLIHLP